MQFWALVTTFLLLGVSALAQAQSRAPARGTAAESAPDLNTIVTRVEQRQLQDRLRLVPYTVTRKYELFASDDSRPSSQVIADISYLPPGQKTYVIKQTNGSNRGEKVVAKVLEHEAEITRASKKVPVSREDYEFSYAGQQVLAGIPCYVLQVKARRSDKDLLNGQLWVDASTYRIRRFAGQPVKSPSWWLKNTQISMDYGWVGDMWLQTGGSGSADVRLLGRHSMVSRDISYQTATQVAQKRSPSTVPGRRRPAPEATMGVMLPR